MPFGLGGPEVVIILLVIVLIFGASKLPDLARSLGRSMRIFKAEVEEMKTDHPRSAASTETVSGVATDRTGATVAEPVQPVQQPVYTQPAPQQPVQQPVQQQPVQHPAPSQQPVQPVQQSADPTYVVGQDRNPSF